METRLPGGHSIRSLLSVLVNIPRCWGVVVWGRGRGRGDRAGTRVGTRVGQGWAREGRLGQMGGCERCRE